MGYPDDAGLEGTPLTDRMVFADEDGQYTLVDASFARRLELKLNVALMELELLRKAVSNEGHT